MDRPSIDDLLNKVPSIYELAMMAARRAVEIKRKDRTTVQPLQKALEEISKGEVQSTWKNRRDSGGEQFELPLEVETVPVAEADETIDEEIAELDTEVTLGTDDAEDEEDEEAVEVEEAEVVEEDESIEEIDEEIYDEEEFSGEEEDY
jgi:DNA-directed RNA polymerase omega subunit